MVNETVQLCFAMEVQGLVRPTLGKGKDTGGRKRIADRL